jgi:DNA-binding beta-propeller fold protein YncE
MRLCLSILAAFAAGCLAGGRARAAPACAYTAGSTALRLPGAPFSIASTADGCWLFVSLENETGGGGGLAVLRNTAGRYGLVRTIRLPQSADGLQLTHDGAELAVADNDAVVILDVGRLESGDGSPVVDRLNEGPDAGAFYTAITPDDHLLFVSDENQARLSVWDLGRGGSGSQRPVLIGHIPMGAAPVGMTLSPDGQRLYATSQVSPRQLGLPVRCSPGDASDKRLMPEGMLSVIDVARAAADPSHAILAMTGAGCAPVRVALDPDGRRAWITARGEDALVDIDLVAAEHLGPHAPHGRRPVGPAPIGIAIRPDDAEIWITDSDRFDTQKGYLEEVALPSGAHLRAAAGRFPRDLIFLPGSTVLVAAITGSDALLFVDTAILPRASAPLVEGEPTERFKDATQ